MVFRCCLFMTINDWCRYHLNRHNCLLFEAYDLFALDNARLPDAWNTKLPVFLWQVCDISCLKGWITTCSRKAKLSVVWKTRDTSGLWCPFVEQPPICIFILRFWNIHAVMFNLLLLHLVWRVNCCVNGRG